jgi:hypothetical protein
VSKQAGPLAGADVRAVAVALVAKDMPGCNQHDRSAAVQYWPLQSGSTILATAVGQYNIGHCSRAVQYWPLQSGSTILATAVGRCHAAAHCNPYS